ncbi:PTS system trehalose(maltose)-specific transporter subunits IIBC [Actinobacillus ureae]|uniref:Phosphotransferase system, EIIB n=1 Tax=Actinobacillus ureae ATCC 25976 TaxID=887324 RepID=E8KFZ2_9PAST|nr:phosphotransferase system, EIIB [Actinobacillus ureae ATCC 25976]SUT85768.1 PTS system trehalose(maltose)-specific transporter subunits IIBC [Actinobacillus ureae]SUU43675.1 PTS system trehalose(maltose)-specific transporter subunits IIBC [Actinobacillus ureae]
MDKLIEFIGGRENIATVTHCITRLRFVLNDDSKVDSKALEGLPMVKANFATGGNIKLLLGRKSVITTKSCWRKPA